VVYSPNGEGLLQATIPAFEQKYDVKVEAEAATPCFLAARPLAKRPGAGACLAALH
jgi:hypothetical protein